MKNKTLVAKVIAVKGLKGELKLKVFTSSPLVISKYQLSLSDGREIKIISSYVQKNLLIVKINDITNIDEAEKLIGEDIYANSSLWDNLNNDEYYHKDLLNIQVVSEEKSPVGKVIAIHNFGAGDILEIQLLSSEDTEMFRFTEEFFPTINVKDGYIVLKTPTLL